MTTRSYTITTTPVDDLADFLKKLKSQEQIEKGGEGSFFCYRGLQKEDWDLIPSVFRPSPENPKAIISAQELLSIEKEIYRDFRDRLRGYTIPNINLNDPLEVMCLAQHYGIPTRLLDWTINPLVAVYFAVSDLKGTGAIWSLNVTSFHPKAKYRRDDYRAIRLSEVNQSTCFFPYLGTPISRSDPFSGLLIIQPPEIDIRIKNQGGVFSIFIPKDNDEDLKTTFDHQELIKTSSTKKKMLRKYTISEDAKRKMKIQLDQMGINANLLYPGLEGLGRFLSDLRNIKVTKVVSKLKP